jgi:hypothetical protein
MDTRGQVEVLQGDGSWAALAEGDRVASGQRLRTGPASHATLVFFDGTRTNLASHSDVTLTQVDGGWGGELRVSLTQNAGRTAHSVVPLRGDHSAFTVLTPSGAASVHGTNFDVAVDALGRSRFGVNTGRVLVSSGADEVFLTAGQATTAQTDGALEDPAYQFTLQGALSSMEGSTWIVEGVPFTVLSETELTGDPQVGSQVTVVGRVLASGEWVADRVGPVENPEESEDGVLSSFTGMLESMGGDVWQIGGWTVAVDGATELAEGLEAGKAVRVTFLPMEDGRWLAIRIELLEEPEDEEPTEEPTTEPTEPPAQPILAFSPAELSAGACGAGELSLAGTLANTAEGEMNAATDLELTYQVVEGSGFVDWVELNPVKIDSLASGSSVDLTIQLALNESFDSAGDTNVQVRVFVLGVDGSRLTIDVENVCVETEAPEVTDTPVGTESPSDTETPAVTDTPEVTVTETVTPTEIVTVTETVTPTVEVTLPVTTTETVPTVEATGVVTSTAVTACTGAQPHPTGMSLAQKYGVPYEEIMSWFCQGFGFGEIDLAYSLSWVSGRPVTEVFALKSGGVGWGEIKQQLETRGNPKKWATPPPETSLPRNPKVQETPMPKGQSIQPTQEPQNPQVQSTPVPPGKQNGKPDKPGKPPKKP